MSFNCPHCHHSNSDIQPGGIIQDQGVRYTLKACQNDVSFYVFAVSNTVLFRDYPPKLHAT